MAVEADQQEESEVAGFIGDIGFAAEWTSEGTLTGVLPDNRWLRVGQDGPFHPWVLASVADLCVGLLAQQGASERISLTTELSLTILGPNAAGPLIATATLLKMGRSLIVGEARFTAPDHDDPVAIAQLAFVPSPRPIDVRATIRRTAIANGFDRPCVEQMGARLIEPGSVELDRRPYVQQFTGTLQGGAIAMLCEVAAASFSRATGRAVESMEIHYLAAVRVGPGRTSATRLSGSVVRIEVRDSGNDDRLAAVALVRVAE